jgi:hypothetical protein
VTSRESESMDIPHIPGWWLFLAGFGWRILDEAVAKVLVRLGAVAARYYDSANQAH